MQTPLKENICTIQLHTLLKHKPLLFRNILYILLRAIPDKYNSHSSDLQSMEMLR